MKLITKIYLAVGFILLFFSIVTTTFLWQAAQTEAEMERVIHSAELLRKSEAMQKSLSDMETGFRGYLLTENEAFLEPYTTGVKTIRKQAEDIKLGMNDPLEINLMLNNEEIGGKWINDFAEVVIAAKRRAIQDKSQQAAFDSLDKNLVNGGVGKRLMDQIRNNFRKFDAYETTIKEQQVTTLEKLLTYTRFITIILTLSAISLGVITAVVLASTFRKRLYAMIEHAESISLGHFNSHIENPGKDEMSRLARSLNRMAVRLQSYFNNITKANRELDQFAYVVSHDLKAPLRAINNLAEWISEDITDKNPEIQKNLQLMRGRVQRMENLINGILAYAKVDRKTIEPEKFAVKQLLEEIVDLLAPPQNVEIVLPNNAPVLTTEKIFLQQVFSNLISNAIKYNNKPQAHVAILVRETGDFYEFSVTDNGPGIPEKFHQKIFGIFQTMEARDTKESTGIGLAIVKKIIDEKGGKIWISSKENEFTSFIFTWPKNSLTAEI
ncbi:sensor histidine kinase [Adhaeribacter terreus]|uniref:histidine kinase n=1 Tax=Adhaeribacter terreus TaxID=529703 RepID=A0ABW0EA93_9BACT